MYKPLAPVLALALAVLAATPVPALAQQSDTSSATTSPSPQPTPTPTDGPCGMLHFTADETGAQVVRFVITAEQREAADKVVNLTTRDQASDELTVVGETQEIGDDLEVVYEIPRPSRTTAYTANASVNCSVQPSTITVNGNATPTPSPSTSKPPCGYIDFTVDRNPIKSGETATITATRVNAGEDGLTARLVRRVPEPVAEVRSDTSNATVVTWPLRLGESHLFLAESVVENPEKCAPLGRPSGRFLQVDIQPVISIAATRNAARNYAFTGRIQPAKRQTVTLYRHEGTRRIITARSVVADNGTYRIDRRFTGSGRFGFSVAVAASSAHLAGSSVVRPTVIH